MKYLHYLIRHWWYFLWIRKDEFNVSLEIDMFYLLNCWPKGGIEKHCRELGIRREIAHQRDMLTEREILCEAIGM